MITDVGEQSVLKSISQGNHDAFWELWLLHQDYLYHRCLSWMKGNHLEAQDVLSQASLKAYEKLPNHAAKITNIKAWLITFTYNLCIDAYRKKN